MIVWLTGWLFGTVAPAQAQTPVVHLDSVPAADAVLLVAQRTGLPDSQLTSLRLGDVLAAPPAVLGAGSLQRCTRPPATVDEVRTHIGRARVALGAEDLPGTDNELDRAVASLGCLTEVVDRAVGAEAFLLRGAILAWTDDLDAAHTEYLTALGFEPQLAWDERLPEAGRAPFQEARATPLDTPIHRLPERAVTGPWLDGDVLDPVDQAGPALHLFQYATGDGIRSGWLTTAGPVTVVVPGAYRATEIESVGTLEGNERFGRLLAAAIPSFEAAYVVHQGGIWLAVREGPDLVVNELTARVPPPEPEPQTRKERRKKRRAERKAEREEARRQR